jgi:hypothetical protein
MTTEKTAIEKWDARDVRPGQRIRDRDPRHLNRVGRVASVTRREAEVDWSTGRSTTVKLSTFRRRFELLPETTP